MLQILTRTGASTLPRWTTCARASICAATRRRTPAGVQARGLRALRRAGRGGQARGHQDVSAVPIRTREDIKPDEDARRECAAGAPEA